MKIKKLIAVSVIGVALLISVINISTLNQERLTVFSLDNAFRKAFADIEIPEPDYIWFNDSYVCGTFEVLGTIYYYWESDCWPGDEDEECFVESCPV